MPNKNHTKSARRLWLFCAAAAICLAAPVESFAVPFASDTGRSRIHAVDLARHRRNRRARIVAALHRSPAPPGGAALPAAPVRPSRLRRAFSAGRRKLRPTFSSAAALASAVAHGASELVPDAVEGIVESVAELVPDAVEGIVESVAELVPDAVEGMVESVAEGVKLSAVEEHQRLVQAKVRAKVAAAAASGGGAAGIMNQLKPGGGAFVLLMRLAPLVMMVCIPRLLAMYKGKGKGIKRGGKDPKKRKGW